MPLTRPGAARGALAECLRVAQPHDVEGVRARGELVAVGADDPLGEARARRVVARDLEAFRLEPFHRRGALIEPEMAPNQREHAAALAGLVVVPEALFRIDREGPAGAEPKLLRQLGELRVWLAQQLPGDRLHEVREIRGAHGAPRLRARASSPASKRHAAPWRSFSLTGPALEPSMECRCNSSVATDSR